MRGLKVALAALGLIIGVLAAVPASAWDRRDASVTTLATLPGLVDASGNLLDPPVFGPVEGLTVGVDNNIYAASNGEGTIANLFVIDPNGNFLNAGMICAPPPLCSAASPSKTRPRTCLGYASLRTTGHCGCSTAGTNPAA